MDEHKRVSQYGCREISHNRISGPQEIGRETCCDGAGDNWPSRAGWHCPPPPVRLDPSLRTESLRLRLQTDYPHPLQLGNDAGEIVAACGYRTNLPNILN